MKQHIEELSPREFESVPRMLRIVMIFIDRVGFPILAFIMMFVMCVVYLNRNTKAIVDNTAALAEIRTMLRRIN